MRYTEAMAHLTITAPLRTIRTWDGILLFWVVFWLVMGTAIAISLWNLSGLADSAIQSGQALDSVGSAFQGLGRIPVIGGGPGQFGTELRDTASGIVAHGDQAGRSIHGLAILLGITVATVPSIPVFGFYLPLRVSYRRDGRQIQSALREEGFSDRLRDFLAQRATLVLSYGEIVAATAQVAPGDSEGRRTQLALAELRRLSLPVPGP